jgi:SAM-dependent methyltransferase
MRGPKGLNISRQERVNRPRERELHELLDAHGLRVEDIDQTTSPNDVMFNGNMVAYLLGGAGSLRAIERGRQAAGIADVRSILDFGCGHGRALRVLRLAYPDARLVGCDVDRDGVEFCRTVLGVEAFVSHPDPREIRVDEHFDVIWAGSVLTHVGADRWPLFLRWFESHLTAPGAAVFTFQSQAARDLIEAGGVDMHLAPGATDALVERFDREGFAYVDYPAQEGYGVTLSSFAWVRDVVDAATSLRIVDHAERGWGAHDVVTLSAS